MKNVAKELAQKDFSLVFFAGLEGNKRIQCSIEGRTPEDANLPDVLTLATVIAAQARDIAVNIGMDEDFFWTNLRKHASESVHRA